MKARFSSVDHPEQFEFHDSHLKLYHADKNRISVYAENLNIHKGTEQNPKKIDLEIKRAHITFWDTSELTYEPGRVWKDDGHGNMVPVGPEIVFHGKEALDIIKKELKSGIEVFSHQIAESDRYIIDGSGIEPFFTITFKARSLSVEWDKYSRPAWYELTKQSKGELIINTPDGEIRTEAHIITHYDQNELFEADDPGKVVPIETSIGIKHSGKMYWGHGKDRFGKEALADLYKKLPEGSVLGFSFA